jgi:hypothetical protein
MQTFFLYAATVLIWGSTWFAIKLQLTGIPSQVSLFYLSLFGSVIAFGCYLALVGSIGADRAANASIMFPIVALVLSTVFEGYRLSLVSGFGIIFGACRKRPSASAKAADEKGSDNGDPCWRSGVTGKWANGVVLVVATSRSF